VLDILPSGNTSPSSKAERDMKETAILIPVIVLGLVSIHTRAASLSGSCKNTVQGEHFVADDAGRVCRRATFEASTGCCKTAELDACENCDPESKCCSEFEMCVSCCLQPKNGADKMMAISPRGANKPDTGYFTNVFDYCRSKCRTNSKSTVHENAYKSLHHHCYDKAASAEVQSQELPPLPTQLQIVKGEQGQNCHKACARQGLSCDQASIKTINTCDKMKAHFPCENGCMDSYGGDQPAYVVPNALRMHQPGTCMINTQREIMSCEGQHANTRRLCPCV